MGPKGDTGNAGPQGPAGTQGATGAAGRSVNVWVMNRAPNNNEGAVGDIWYQY
jgi:hypothetical protein